MAEEPQKPDVAASTLRATPPGGSRPGTVLGPGAPLAGLRVLVVDDEPDVRRVVAKRIARFGAEVETASDGVEATALTLRESPSFDIVITDQTMPGRSGDEFVRAVRAAGSRVPVVIMSGFNASGTTIAPDGLGAQTFLAKPFDSAQLLAALLDGLGARVGAGGPAEPASDGAARG